VKSDSYKQDSLFIVYDAGRLEQPGAELFDPDWWRARGAVTGEAAGRGSAWFIDAPFGAAVLRRYLRGGLPGRFIRDRYLFTGWRRSRPVAEFRILETLAAAGLPAPAPLAAAVQRHGLTWSGSLLTRLIPSTRTFADLLVEHSDDHPLWQRIGACIRRFHDAGVVHADLNARNILVDADGAVFLVDFDRAHVRPGARRRFRRNLARLRRSLEKLWPDSLGAQALDEGWRALERGYRAGA